MTPKVMLQMISRSVYSFEVKRAIKKIIQDTQPDLVYVLHYVNKLSPSVIRGAKEMGLPVVLRLSDYFLLCPRFDFFYRSKVCEDCLSRGLISCIKKRCIKDSLFASVIRVYSMKIHKLIGIYKDIDAYIAPSEFIKEKLSVNGFDGSKIYHIPTFTAGSISAEEPSVGDYGLYFGRITEEKGVDVLVQAYEQLEDSRLVIVGDDTTSEGTALKAYVKKRKLSNIEFMGFKKGPELESIIKKSRFILIPSLWYDNLPNTALEAFLYSKPVIASGIGSLPELVTDGYNGYLFGPGNVRELMGLIKRMQDEALVEKLGANSLKILTDKFTAESHYSSLMGLFETLAASRIKCEKNS